MNFSGFIFDFDYTLGDSTNGIVLSTKYALEQMRYPLPDVEKIKQTIGLSLTDTFKALTNDNDLQKSNLFSMYFKEMADKVMVQNTIVYPEAIEAIKALKNMDAKVGIVTTKYHYRIEQILLKYNLNNYVDAIIGSDNVSEPKPNSEGLLKIMDILQLDKSETVYIGDTLVDAKTAGSASVSFIGVLTGVTTMNEFKKHEHLTVLSDVGEIIHIM